MTIPCPRSIRLVVLRCCIAAALLHRATSLVPWLILASELEDKVSVRVRVHELLYPHGIFASDLPTLICEKQKKKKPLTCKRSAPPSLGPLLFSSQNLLFISPGAIMPSSYQLAISHCTLIKQEGDDAFMVNNCRCVRGPHYSKSKCFFFGR